jgi:hypothetical protein
MIEEEIIGSQTDESLQDDDTSMDDVFAAFGIEKPEEKKEEEAEVTDPAIDQKPESKKFTVKYNKEDVEIDEDKIPEYVQKGLALDKERDRRSELEKSLDRAAKLAGYQDHATYVADLDRLEQQQQQQKENQFTDLRSQLIQDYVDAGGDSQNIEAWLDNNPLLNQAKEVLDREQLRNEQEQIQAEANQKVQQYESLYAEFPELKGQVKQDGGADWYTAQMHELVENGTPPLIAYRALNAESIADRRAKSATQRVIKEQQLGLRSQVETNTAPDNEPSVPDDLANAFAAFGLPPSAAKKYVK